MLTISNNDIVLTKLIAEIRKLGEQKCGQQKCGRARDTSGQLIRHVVNKPSSLPNLFENTKPNGKIITQTVCCKHPTVYRWTSALLAIAVHAHIFPCAMQQFFANISGMFNSKKSGLDNLAKLLQPLTFITCLT